MDGDRGDARPRPGGLRRVNPSGHAVMAGQFLEVDPPRRIVFSWGWELELFSTPPRSTVVEISLTADGDETVVRLVHRRARPDAMAFHRLGWDHYLPRLALVASGGDPGEDPWRDPTVAISALRRLKVAPEAAD